MEADVLQPLANARVHSLPGCRGYAIRPYNNQEHTAPVNLSPTDAHVVRPGLAETSFDAACVFGRLGLQAVDADLAIPDVESVERGADPIACERSLRSAGCDGLNEFPARRVLWIAPQDAHGDVADRSLIESARSEGRVQLPPLEDERAQVALRAGDKEKSQHPRERIPCVRHRPRPADSQPLGTRGYSGS